MIPVLDDEKYCHSYLFLITKENAAKASRKRAKLATPGYLNFDLSLTHEHICAKFDFTVNKFPLTPVF